MATWGMPSAPTPSPLRITVKNLLLQIDRNIRVVLEQPQLAFGFQAHAAGGCIGDAAIRESQARVGDIDLIGKYAGADGIDRHHRRAHDAQDQVDVVNHQIQHHVDIRAAVLERRKPRRLDETWHGERRLHRPYRGIEALQMAHLQNALGRARDLDEALPSATVTVMGFSTSTLAPASRKAFATSKCVAVGVTMLTASTLPNRSR